jgi:hypothetical protein
MICRTCAKHVKSFASSTSLLDSSLPGHNDVLAGDTLYNIQLNYQWRKILVAALESYFQHGDAGLALDNDDLFNNLINDFYDAEALGASLITRINRVDLNTDKNTNSTTFVMVTGSNFSHTPQKANMSITVMNLAASMSDANEVLILPRFNGLAGAEEGAGITSGGAIRYLQCAAKFTGLTPGVAHDISLYWRVSGGTATLDARVHPLFLIEEYD